MGRPAIILIVCLTLTTSATGQWIGKQTGCYADQIAANPNRPTVSNPATVTQYGVLEVEYGFDRYWPEEGSQLTSSGALVKIGMFCDIEFRWLTTAILSQSDETGTHRTIGDNWLGTEIRFHRQTSRLPTMALSYAFKIPSASTEAGLGSGHVDHAFTLGVSETVRHLTLDFNLTELLIGKSAGDFDSNQQYALAFSRPVWHGLQFIGEFYGQTKLNQTTPAYASSLWAMSYTVRPRLVIDGGYEVGLTSGGPQRHFFVGATYAITNLYQRWRQK